MFSETNFRSQRQWGICPGSHDSRCYYLGVLPFVPSHCRSFWNLISNIWMSCRDLTFGNYIVVDATGWYDLTRIIYEQAVQYLWYRAVVKSRMYFVRSYTTDALKDHRALWKIEICYFIRLTEWKHMSAGWHNNIVVTHLDEIPTSANSPGLHMMVWCVIRMTYCCVHKPSGWDTAKS